jgi:hypothetical protein
MDAGFVGHRIDICRPNLQFSLYFTLLSGICGLETGSHPESVVTGKKNEGAPSAKLLATVTDKPMEIIEAVEKQKETVPVVGGGTKTK